jgi:hypothetical protein
VTAGRIDFMGKIFVLQMVTITQRESRTFSSKQPCCRASNAIGGAGDQHALAF